MGTAAETAKHGLCTPPKPTRCFWLLLLAPGPPRSGSDFDLPQPAWQWAVGPLGLLLRAIQVPVQRLGQLFWKPTQRTKVREAGLLRSLPVQRTKGQPQGTCPPYSLHPLGGTYKSPRSNGLGTAPKQPLHYHLSMTSGDGGLHVTEHVNPDVGMWVWRPTVGGHRRAGAGQASVPLTSSPGHSGAGVPVMRHTAGGVLV